MDNNICDQSRDIYNPIGPSFAACLGVSEVFKKFLGLKSVDTITKWYSIYDFRSNPSPEKLMNPDFPDAIEIGKTFQIGCGAVGSSFDLLLSFVNVKGSISLIDYDTVSVENTASSMLFTANDSFQEEDKIVVCKSILDKVEGLNVSIYKNDYGSFINENGLLQNYPDRILCLGNEKNRYYSF